MKNNASNALVDGDANEHRLRCRRCSIWYGLVHHTASKVKSLCNAESNAPKVAGEDELGGAARNPQQFDEPDEDALEEMGKLLGEDDDSIDEA